MNEACSAGTGSFLEESALESFNVDVKEIAGLALQGNAPPNFSDQCAAFISSDIKNASHEGISREDILAGLVYSICFNYANRVKGHRPTGSKVFMQGGVCYNKAVPLAMASILKKEIVVPPEPGLMGARAEKKAGTRADREGRFQAGGNNKKGDKERVSVYLPGRQGKMRLEMLHKQDKNRG
jgi:activator of 2-hydroxyglutaryl-CoA dehydratase